MPKVSEINEGHWTRWRNTAIEWLAVVIAGLALLLSVTSFIISTSSSLYLNSRVTAQKESLDVYRIRAAKMDAYLKAKGIPIESIYGEK